MLSWKVFPAISIKLLQLIQNPAAKLVFNEPKRVHVAPLFISLHLLLQGNNLFQVVAYVFYICPAVVSKKWKSTVQAHLNCMWRSHLCPNRTTTGASHYIRDSNVLLSGVFWEGQVPRKAGSNVVAWGAAVCHNYQPFPRQQWHQFDGCWCLVLARLLRCWECHYNKVE